MPRKEMHSFRRPERINSMDTSIHGSDYNADAASAQSYRMGPSHKSARAQRLIEKIHRRASQTFSMVSQIDEEETLVNVIIHDLKIDGSPKTMSIEGIDYNRRQVRKGLYQLEDFIEQWLKWDKAIPRKACAERHQTAVKIEDELRKIMHQIRELRNYCKALLHDRRSAEHGRSVRRRDVEYVDDKLEDMATVVEQLQVDVEAERRSMLKAFKKANDGHARVRRVHREYR